MPVAEAVHTFAGISNENEFYSHHYLAEVFKGDIKARLEEWQTREEEEPAFRTPNKRLAACAGRWFADRDKLSRTKDPKGKLSLFAGLNAGLLSALGYAANSEQIELQAGQPLPAWVVCGAVTRAPQLLILPAYHPGHEDSDTFEQTLASLHYNGVPVPPALAHLGWDEIISDAVFGADQPPRFVILVGLGEWILLDRFKWPANRALRFDWDEILDRKDMTTLQAAAALLHIDSLAPGTGSSLLESLDENAHKHAFGVSEDLKYAIREAIELIGNEAARQLDEQATGKKKSVYSGEYKIDLAQISLECLRLVYRLLFMFYIEARPELGYVPIRKSDVYLKGYSLESLRDLELVPLNTPAARDGHYFDETLKRLFDLVYRGSGAVPQQALVSSSVRDAFTLVPLDSKLFDPAGTPLLNRVGLPNSVWQTVIRLMSLSSGKSNGRGGNAGRRKGRVGYQLLSINQLGAVYEALLAYRGFFASEDLYEVKPEQKKTRATGEQDDEAEDADGEGSENAGGTSTDVLDSAWFVPASRIEEYRATERVVDVDENGHQRLRRYAKGTFIYRLAGRDRQKSASYYTPQSLTSCLVKYALKELLKDRTANDILQLTVVEPAMGSAAFLNEAVNQLSETYLDRKQAELGRRIPHEQYARELQKVRMYFADRNVFGVDLNPVAVELAEVSLWLNAIYGEPDQDSDGNPLPPRPARVPWFGYQLFTGNSLIGARRDVYHAHQLRRGANPPWYDEAPRRLDPREPVRQPDEVYHFLLPDPGFAHYTDKVAKRPARIMNSNDNERPSAGVEVDLRNRDAATVVLAFSEGTGTVLAGLRDFVGTITVDKGRVTNVSYSPSRRSPLWSEYQHEAERLDRLRADVAAAARLGVLRFEGPRAERNRAANVLADRMRMLKGIDPTLGLYAAYAYFEADASEQVRSVEHYVRENLNADLYDIAMLSGKLANPAAVRGPYPFCPMLAQGWSLLRAKGVKMNELVDRARDHMNPSLWTTFDPVGVELVRKAAQTFVR